MSCASCSKRAKLQEEIDVSHKAVLQLANLLYMYAGECISKEHLLKEVRKILSEEYVEMFEHRYIIKDTYQTKSFDAYEDIDCSTLNDVEELNI